MQTLYSHFGLRPKDLLQVEQGQSIHWQKEFRKKSTRKPLSLSRSTLGVLHSHLHLLDLSLEATLYYNMKIHFLDDFYSSALSPAHVPTVFDSLREFLETNWFEACYEILVLLFVCAVWVPLRPHSAKLTKVASEDTPLANDASVNDKRQVQQLVHDILDEANYDSADVCDLYVRLVKQKSINLREYIQDDRHAQALFISLLKRAINSKRHELVSSLMADMQQMSISRNLCFYASVMKVYSKENMHQEALKMYDFVVLDKLKPDSSMCICLMNSAIACDELDKAHQFFSELCKSETPFPRTYMAMLRTYQKENKWEAAVDILQILKDTGIVPDNLVFNNVLGICISAKQVGVAADLLETWKDTPDLVDVISYNTVLKGYAQQVNVDESEALLTRMQNHGVIPNLISFNTVMDCAVRAKQLIAKQHGRHPHNIHRESEDEGGSLCFPVNFPAISTKPWDIVRRMEALGLAPDIYTCSTLVKGMHLSGCNAREIDEAMKLLKAVGPEALKSNDNKNAHLCEVLFNSMLDVCVNVKDLNRLGQVFEMMRDCQVAVTACTFGILIKAFGQARRLDRILEVWAEMRRVKVRPTAVTYGCCIDACIQNGDIDTAMTIFEEMKPGGCVPNAVIYTSLIRGFASVNLPERALALYKDMRLQGIECSSATVNLLADLIARHAASDHMAMAHVSDDMLACQVQPDISTYSILIKANCAMRNLQNAMSLFEHLKEEGLAIDESTFNVLLNGCSKQFRVDHAETVLAYMRVLAVRPSNITLSILVKLYGRAKMLDKAIEIVSVIEHDYKLEPNLFVYTCLIQACFQNRQDDRGWNVFRSMQKKGIEPDAITYGALIHGCLYTNKVDLAMTIVNQVYNVQCNDSSKDSSTNLIHYRKPLSKTGEALSLQPEVLNLLLLALNRKGKIDQAAHLECLMNANNIAINPKRQRSKIAHTCCAKDVKHNTI